MQRFASVMPGMWHRSTVPENVEVDVFYVNHTFHPPASGMLHLARRQGSRLSVVGGGAMPLCYVVCWKRSDHSVVGMGDENLSVA